MQILQQAHKRGVAQITLTATERLALYLKGHKLGVGQAAWSNDCFSWRQWLASLMSKSAFLYNTPQVLDATGAFVIARQVADGIPELGMSWAAMCLDAYGILKQHQIGLSLYRKEAHTAAQQHFVHFYEAFDVQLSSMHHVLLEQSVDVLLAHSDEHLLALIGGEPLHLVIKGFDEIPPDLSRLLGRFRALHMIMDIESYTEGSLPPHAHAPCMVHRYASPTLEQHAILKWAQDQENACVIVRDLKSMYRPFAMLASEYPECVNIAAGLPLSDYPVVARFLKTLARAEGFCFRREHLQHVLPEIPEALSSQNYQVFEKLQTVLQQWVCADSFTGPISMASAHFELTHLLETTSFQPQQSGLAKVHVLGALESCGLMFDAVWLSGFSETTWPPPEIHQPFLPYAISRVHHLPNATSERQLFYATRLTERLLRQGTSIVCSVSDEAGRPGECSGLLTSRLSFESQYHAYHDADDSVIDAQIRQIRFQQIPMAPIPWGDAPLKSLNQLLSTMATCPYRAYAMFHLNLKEPEVLLDQWNVQRRGLVLHEILCEVYGHDVGSMDHEARMVLIASLVHKHMHLEHHQTSIALPFLEIEMQKLKILILRFLEKDDERRPFKVIERETWAAIDWMGYPFRLRIDRMDETPKGRVLLDYKTSMQDLKVLFEHPSLQPQLIVYALTHDVDAIMYATIHFKNISIYGVTLDDVPGWTKQDLHAFWKNDLEQTFQRFLTGVFEKRPIDGLRTCARCHVRMVCRKPWEDHHGLDF